MLFFRPWYIEEDKTLQFSLFGTKTEKIYTGHIKAHFKWNF